MARSSRLVLIASQWGPLLSNCSYLYMSTVMCLVELFILWVFDVTNAENIISNILLLTINSLTISQTSTFFHTYVRVHNWDRCRLECTIYSNSVVYYRQLEPDHILSLVLLNL